MSNFVLIGIESVDVKLKLCYYMEKRIKERLLWRVENLILMVDYYN